MHVSFNRFKNCDDEHLRIIRKLRSLGIVPSGDKTVDKAKLKKAQEEPKKIFEMTRLNQITAIDTEIEKLEEERNGANNIALQNRIYFGL